GSDWAELQLRAGTSGAWTCLKRGVSPASDFSGTSPWDTNNMPSSCTGAPNQSRNGEYQLRLHVRESLTAKEFSSATYTLGVANRPSTPAWAADPTSSGESDRAPVVELHFNGSPEPDVLEYHFIRQGTDGANEFAVG